MSQNTKILKMLEAGPITAMDALREADCFRLAARIYDLRAQGHNIISHNIKRKNKVIAMYRLVKNDDSIRKQGVSS
jgi:hypothetical protein